MSDSPDTYEKFTEYRRSGDRKLRNELVEEHVRLAEFLARRFAHRGESPNTSALAGVPLAGGPLARGGALAPGGPSFGTGAPQWHVTDAWSQAWNASRLAWAWTSKSLELTPLMGGMEEGIAAFRRRFYELFRSS